MLTGVMNELSAARTDAQAPAWRHLPALQQPAYPDEAALAGVVADLRRRPPLGHTPHRKSQERRAGHGWCPWRSSS